MFSNASKLGILAVCMLGLLLRPAIASEIAAITNGNPSQIAESAADDVSTDGEIKASEIKLAKSLHAYREFWIQYREKVQAVSTAAAQVRNEWYVPYFGFAFFLIYLARKNIPDARLFFNQMMKKHPLPAFRNGGVNDENIMQARKVLFYALPMVLAGSVVLSGRWLDDDDRQEQMLTWLNTKLEGMNVKWGEMRRMVVGIFLVSFGPYFLAHLFGWLDALSQAGDQFAVYLASA